MRDPKEEKMRAFAEANGLPVPDPAARPAPAPEERWNPNRLENEFMLNLMVLRTALARNAPACRERARKAGKWAWRDIRLMLTLVARLQAQFLATMPRSRLEYYQSYARGGHYEFRMDHAPAKETRLLPVTVKNLSALCDAAMQNECIMCVREGREIGRCKLREALLEVAPPTELQDGRWIKCEYRDAAGDLLLGRDTVRV